MCNYIIVDLTILSQNKAANYVTSKELGFLPLIWIILRPMVSIDKVTLRYIMY